MTKPHFNTAFSRQIALWVLRAFSRKLARNEFFRKGRYIDDDLAGFLAMPPSRKSSAMEVEARLDGLLENLKATRLPVGLRKFQRENVGVLSKLFGFDDTDRAIFTYLICLRIDQSLIDAHSNILRVIHKDPARYFSIVLGLPRRDVSRALAPDSKLRSCGIVSPQFCSGSLPSDRNRRPFRNRPPEDDEFLFFNRSLARKILSPGFCVANVMRQFGTTPPAPELGLGDYPHIASPLETLLLYLKESFARKKRGVNILFHGPPGTGKTQLSRVVGKALGTPVFELSSESRDGAPFSNSERFLSLRASQTIFRAKPTIFVLDEAEDVFYPSSFDDSNSAASNKRWFNQLLESNQSPVVWISNSIRALDPAFTRRFDLILEIPVPPRRQRIKILEKEIGSLVGAETIRRMADCEHLAPAVAARAAGVVRDIRCELPAGTRDAAFTELVSNTLKAQGFPDPARTVLDPIPRDTYDIAHLNTGADLAKIAESLRGHPSARLCLHGPPGTGKTAFAHWLTRKLDRPLLARKASDLLGPYVGETEQNIRRAFDAARIDGAVLLIDEMDSFLQNRRNAHRSWEVTQTNEMLTQIESFPGTFVASTNLIENFDPASLRRFDIKLHFDCLRPEQNARLFAAHCRDLGLPRPTAADLARAREMRACTPGDFAAVARQHRFQPFSDAAGLLRAVIGELEHKEGPKQRIGFR